MKIRTIFFLLLLSACTPISNNVTFTTAPVTPISTESSVTKQPFPIESVSSNHITLKTKKECINLVQSSQNEHNDDILIFQENVGDRLVFLDLSAGSQKFVPDDPKTNVWDAHVSPDGKWLLYELDPNDGSSEYKLVLTQADGIQKKETEFGDWNVGSIFWLNNSTVRVAEPDNDMTYLQNFALDLFTDKKISLPSDFPHLAGRGVEWGIDRNAVSLGIGKGINILYDPTLTRALYPKAGSPPTLSLYDLEANQEIRDLAIPGKPKLPKWSPTGENFAVVGTESNSSNGLLDVFIIISKDGSEIKQLSYLRAEFKSVHIEDYSWSPDGTQIAFWVHQNESPTDVQNNSELAVLDLQANTITYYCISGMSTSQFEKEFERYTTTANLIWSPNSNQVLIARKMDDSDRTEEVVVSLTDKVAYNVIEDMEPIGWMSRR